LNLLLGGLELPSREVVFVEELVHGEPVGLRQRNPLEEGLAFGAEEARTVSVVISQHPADAVLHGSDPPLDPVPLPDELTVLALAGRGTVRGRDHLEGQQFGEDLGVEIVALAGRLGDYAELFWDGPG
jgi:hypothetical protein